jgi:hypothetical protein
VSSGQLAEQAKLPQVGLGLRLVCPRARVVVDGLAVEESLQDLSAFVVH